MESDHSLVEERVQVIGMCISVQQCKNSMFLVLSFLHVYVELWQSTGLL